MKFARYQTIFDGTKLMQMLLIPVFSFSYIACMFGSYHILVSSGSYSEPKFIRFLVTWLQSWVNMNMAVSICSDACRLNVIMQWSDIGCLFVEMLSIWLTRLEDTWSMIDGFSFLACLVFSQIRYLNPMLRGCSTEFSHILYVPKINRIIIIYIQMKGA